MYKYTDLTYPHFFAVSADYSLFFATGLVTSLDVHLPHFDRSAARSRVSFRVSQKISVSVGVADSFKIGRGSVWCDRIDFEENARVAGVIRLFDRSYLSEYLKVKGERQRKGDSVGSIDSFSVVVFACASEFVLSADSVVIKNPDSASFVLGDTSLSDTALGGRLYV